MILNKKVTLVPGTPINLAAIFFGDSNVTGMTYMASSIFIQMAANGTGLGYVLTAPVGTTPATSNATDVACQLTPASAGLPGGFYQKDAPANRGGGIDARQFWIDGAAADDVIVSIDFDI